MTGKPIPSRMCAIAISEPGGPEVLRPIDAPVPRPGHGEILIRVAAAGVNRPDTLQRRGAYPPPPGAPDIPGLEVAGTVAAAGPGVDAWRPGDAVCALLAGGGYAEFCTAPAVQALPVPRGLNETEAAALPETFFTVWHNLFERAHLRAGERLLVHGGASGIGTTAIQLARAFGARVFATAGSPEKCALCERLGAERAIAYRAEDFLAAVREQTDGEGVDVVLDMVGAPYLARNIALLRPEGRLVSIAFLKGSRAEIDLMPAMVKRLTLTGSTLRPQSIEAKGRIAAGLQARVWPLIEAGRIAPVIDSVFPLRDAARAHARMEEGAHAGKIVLRAA